MRRKRIRVERLPLTTEVGEGIACYLHRRRPETAEGPTVFVRIKAPHRLLTSGGPTQVGAAAHRRDQAVSRRPAAD